MTGIIRVHAAGGREVLSWESVDVAAPGPGELRVRQTAVGINYIDVYYRTGLYAQTLPFIPGVKGAGCVEESLQQLAHSWHTSDESEKVALDPLASEAVSPHPSGRNVSTPGP